MTLSLCMIAKNEEKFLPVMWSSVNSIIDEWILVDTGSTDGTVRFAKSCGAKVIEAGSSYDIPLTDDHQKFFSSFGIQCSPGETIFNFSAARNESFRHATRDFILWLDADDILVGRDKLKTIIRENLSRKSQVGLHLLYEYDFDRYRNPIVQHWRERVVPNNGTFRWQGVIHEILVPSFETTYIRVAPEDSRVIHISEGNRKSRSVRRNTRSLLFDLHRQGDSPDPRTLFFLAESLKIEGNLLKSIELYERYLSLSNWDEERCIASTRIATSFIQRGDYSRALHWSFEAIKERPDFPVGYSTASQVFYLMEDYPSAEKMAKIALDTPQPETLVMYDQKYNRFIPLYILSDIYLNQGLFKESLSMSSRALEFEPQNEDILRINYTANKLLKENEFVRKSLELVEDLKQEGNLQEALRFLSNLPSHLRENPQISQTRSTLSKESSDSRSTPEPSSLGDQHRLLLNDLLRFKCKSVLVLSHDKDSPVFEWLSSKGLDVRKFSDVPIDSIPKADAVFIDQVLHRLSKSERLHALDWAGRTSKRLVAISVPNRDPSSVTTCTPEVVERWMSRFPLLWNRMPLGNGFIYSSSILLESIPVKPKVTFFCGVGSSEDWGPLSHLDKGCGGSEEAVIYLSKELVKLGYPVEVINTFPHPCHVEGVKWRHVSTIEPEEEFQLLVLWRLPHFLDEYSLKADRTFLWLHDVPQTYWFTPDRLSRIERIIVLSRFHRSFLSDIPDEKFFVSSNGVDVQQFPRGIRKNPHRIIYTSSYDRGLEHLLRMWPNVRKEVPDAELHIFYGWETFDRLRTDPKSRKWKSEMVDLMNQDGVFDHGRIDQVSLAKEYLASGVFAYPCHFEEISCISLMKAQVAGCIPLTTDYGALKETNHFPEYLVRGNPKEDPSVVAQFEKRLIEVLRTPKKLLSRHLRYDFSWRKVALDWDKLFTIHHRKSRNSR